jgi:hypothetical protein
MKPIDDKTVIYNISSNIAFWAMQVSHPEMSHFVVEQGRTRDCGEAYLQ